MSVVVINDSVVVSRLVMAVTLR